MAEQVKDQMEEEVKEQMKEQAVEQTKEPIKQQTTEQTKEPMKQQVAEQTKELIKQQTTEQTKEPMKQQMTEETKEQTENVKYVYVPVLPVGPRPLSMTCPHCHEKITTLVFHTPSARTHMMCLLLSLFGCILCAPCVYCKEEFRQKEHWCPKCENHLGTYDG